MSLFKKFSDAIQDLTDNAETLFNRITTQDTLQRVVYAAGLVAWADGDCDSDEKAKTMQVIKAKLPQFGARDVAKYFGELNDMMELGMDFGRPDVLATIKKCNDKEEADLIVRTSILIGHADGSFDNDEKLMVKKIISALNLKPADYGL